MPIYKREVIMQSYKRDVWLRHEQRANGYFNFAVAGITGTEEDHQAWLQANGIDECNYYIRQRMVFFTHDDAAMRFLLAWSK